MRPQNPKNPKDPKKRMTPQNEMANATRLLIIILRVSRSCAKAQQPSKTKQEFI